MLLRIRSLLHHNSRTVQQPPDFDFATGGQDRTAQAEAVQTLGGYRIVRRLGSGPRADVWLGHDGDSVAAVKVFRAGVERRSIDTEVEALGRASSRHLVQLSDLATAPDGQPCLIFERLLPAGLGRVLAGRAVASGEAVTILAPIALATAELHRVGVAHGAIGARAVLFDEVGAPVLSCFGAATLVGAYPDPPTATSLTGAQLAAETGVVRDLQQLAELTRRVLFGVFEGAGVCEWLGTSDPEADPGQWPLELADRVYRIGEPTAVLVHGETMGEVVPNNVVQRADARSVILPGAQALQARQLATSVDAHRRLAGILALPPSVVEAFSLWGRRSAVHSWLGARFGVGFGARFGVGIKAVRPRVWGLAGIMTVVVTAGVIVLGSVDQQNAVPIGAEGVVRSRTAEPRPVTAQQSDPQGGHQATSDDPIIAATALLSARSECLRQLSVLCLDDVDQPESAAHDADSYTIRLAQQGSRDPASADYSTGIVDLVERLGDTALLNVTIAMNGEQMPPASLLLVRGEAGWLIRDLIAADGGVSG